MKYYIQINDKAYGPLDEEYILHLLELRKIEDSALLSTDTQNWQKLASFPAFTTAEVLELVPSPPNPSQTNEKKWYYSLDGTEMAGPVLFDDLLQMVQNGFIRPETIVWQEGDDESRLIKEEPAFAEFFPSENSEGNHSRGFFKRLMSFRSRN